MTHTYRTVSVSVYCEQYIYIHNKPQLAFSPSNTSQASSCANTQSSRTFFLTAVFYSRGTWIISSTDLSTDSEAVSNFSHLEPGPHRLLACGCLCTHGGSVKDTFPPISFSLKCELLYNTYCLLSTYYVFITLPSDALKTNFQSKGSASQTVTSSNTGTYQAALLGPAHSPLPKALLHIESPPHRRPCACLTEKVLKQWTICFNPYPSQEAPALSRTHRSIYHS